MLVPDASRQGPPNNIASGAKNEQEIRELTASSIGRYLLYITGSLPQPTNWLLAIWYST